MSEYLMIENRGTVGTKLLTVVGASTARGKPDMIGQFGSGFKNSIALLLRNGIRLVVYIGKQGYEFGFDNTTDRDVRNEDVEQARVIGIREVIWKPQTIGEMGDLLAQQLEKLVPASQ